MPSRRRRRYRMWTACSTEPHTQSRELSAAPQRELGRRTRCYSRPVTPLADLPLVASGKVREIYEGSEQTLLIVASDRISTYDVVHPTPIPDKGRVLTGLSTFWFERTEGIVANHLVSVTDGVPEEARGRAMVVRK